ncbi:Serpentine Receptor, class T [Caenorhabditis elegans]|uniref:Serpentine Receptor, class T n=1 Tax=Caenorhabditis elegans TaxID=6239 RepID=Q22983_CAEEL|nr:Serpentine Receptor, class T [Caenorhabditis elegans]CCD71394.1 Serpentine Receptor, class T [Caenorhabditis elegans]|eukprot:NP_504177.1 Serpentine Receptor, class T [Caenorhabditis elegans]
MNHILRYGSIDRIPMYNCSARTPSQWTLETGEPQPIIGPLQVAYGIIVLTLYIPIALIMLEKENYKLTSFKIMFQLAITDIIGISINSVLTGILAIQGAVFCTYPTFIYLSGLFVMCLWCLTCLTSLILVCNRLLIFFNPNIEAQLFEGRKTFIILGFSLVYGGYFLFTTPHVYNSKHLAWFFDPMIFPGRAHDYDNFSHAFNNFSIVAITCVLYIPFYEIVRKRLKDAHSHSRAQNMKLQVFIQSVLICIATQIASIIYVFMNLFKVSTCVILIGHALWQFVQGAPVFIYIGLNEQIRKRFFQLLRCHGNGVGSSVRFVANPSVFS